MENNQPVVACGVAIYEFISSDIYTIVASCIGRYENYRRVIGIFILFH